MKHCFIDAETFGSNAIDCAVIDISAIVVDSDRMVSNNPYTMESIVETKRFKLSVQDQVVNCNRIVYESGIKYWQEQSQSARQHIKARPTDLKISEFTDEFLKYIQDFGKIDRWWSRSNTFDPILLTGLFESQKKYNILNEYLPFWKVRDVRTYIDAKLDYPKKNGFTPIPDEVLWNSTFVQHDSSWDILADVLRMQAIIRAENDLEQVQK